MTDVEQRLTRLLHDVGDGIIVHPDLDQVVGRRSGEDPERSRGRTAFVVLAAAAILAMCGGFLLLRPGTADRPGTETPSEQVTLPPPTDPISTDPISTEAVIEATTTGVPDLPHNGVITTYGVNHGYGQVDPDGLGRTVTLPTDLHVTWPAPAWSPDGRRIAFIDAEGVQVRDMATGVTRQVTPCQRTYFAGCSLAWSPDGRSIAFTDGLAIKVVDADGPSHQVATAIVRDFVQPEVIGWSHDGERVVYIAPDHVAVGEEISEAAIKSVRADGTDEVTIVDAANAGALPRVIDAAISPLDSTIVWTEWNEQDELELRMVQLDGSGLTDLRQLNSCVCISVEPTVVWSPDGLRYAVSAPSEPRSDLFRLTVYGLDGTTTDIGAYQGALSWLPELG